MWPEAHQTFLDRAIPRLKEDHRLLGVAAGGSRLSGKMDEFSDLDLVVITEAASYRSVMEDRLRIAEGLGQILVGFQGDHVGEPRLLICLYEEPLLHVDLKFVSLNDFADRVEDPEILWEHDGALTEALHGTKPSPELPDLQWMENRFWVWVHYGAMRIGRGEIFEAIDMLSFMRSKVLGPLILSKKGERPRGVRRVEQVGGEDLSALRATVPLYDARSCEISLKEAAKLYVDLRETLAPADLVRHRRAEMAAMRYLHEVSEKLG